MWGELAPPRPPRAPVPWSAWWRTEALADRPGRGDHVAQGDQDLRVVAGLEAAVGVDPQPGRADRLEGLGEQRGHLVGRRHPGRVDVVDPEADLAAVAG